jgi:multicomponent Na+:H+ antiporter subunit E
MTGTGRSLTTRDRVRNRIAVVATLVLVWALLWGSFSWASLLSGLAVAAIVLTFFPLPPVTFAGRIRPIGGLRFLARFLYDLVVASAQISWLAFRVGRQPRSAIIAVTLRIHSDLNLTLVAEAVSLVPGSLIIEADRSTGTLYVHILGVSNLADVERARRAVLAVEARLVRTIGTIDELSRLAGPDPLPPVRRPLPERKEPL